MTFPIPAQVPTEVTFLDAGDSPTATIHFSGITVAALRDCYDAAFGALGTAIGSGAITPAGPALGIYRGDPSGTFDLEVGFPLADPLEQEATFDGFTVRSGTNLAGAWAVLGHVGPYDGLPRVWAQLGAGVEAAGRTLGALWVEAYVSDPMRTPAEQLRTDLFASLS